MERWRKLREDVPKQHRDDRVGVGVSRMTAAVPYVAGNPVEAQERQVGSASAIFGIVSHGRFFLSAEYREDGGIEVEDCILAGVDTTEHIQPPPVVKRDEFVATVTGKAHQETPQRGSFGVTRQAGQVLEDSVVSQGLGCFDATQAEDEGVKQRLDGFADGVIVVALGETNPSLDLAAHSQLLQERVEQSDTAEGREACSIARNSQISGSSGHRRQTALLVGFHEAGTQSPNIAVFRLIAR